MRIGDRILRAARKTNGAASESGVTLIELVVVIAIIGILIAITVPTIRGFLENARRQAHEADRRTIQVAVDAYYTSTNNEKYNGQRQYPIIGKHKAGGPWAWNRLQKCTGSDLRKPIVFERDSLDNIPDNHPFGGIRGGTPIWQEGGGVWKDDVRNHADSPGSENLYCPTESSSSGSPVSPTGDEGDGTEDHWLGDYVTDACNNESSDNPTGTQSQSTSSQDDDLDRCLIIDSRDYLIDFCELIAHGFIEEFPRSASLDHDRDCVNAGTDGTDASGAVASNATPENAADPPEENPPGSYTWYVDEDGKVQSLYYFFPTSSAPDNRGYFGGVYP